MALSASALVAVAAARAILGIDDGQQDAKVEDAINKASALAENIHCMRPLRRRVITSLRVEGPCGTRLYPEAWPIDTTGSVSVIVNGVAQTVWKSEADGDPASNDVQVYADHFFRAVGWASTSALPRNVVLSYSGGYEPVPDDLQEATLELVGKLWGPLTQQRPDYASTSGPGGSLQTLDGQWAGSSSGIPFSLSRRSKEVFEVYRRVRAG